MAGSRSTYSTDPNAITRRAQRWRKHAYDRIRKNHGLAPIKYKKGYVQTDAAAKEEADSKGHSAARPEQELVNLRKKAKGKSKAESNSKDDDAEQDEEDESDFMPKTRAKPTLKRKKGKSHNDCSSESDVEDMGDLPSDGNYGGSASKLKRERAKAHTTSPKMQQGPKDLTGQ